MVNLAAATSGHVAHGFGYPADELHGPADLDRRRCRSVSQRVIQGSFSMGSEMFNLKRGGIPGSVDHRYSIENFSELTFFQSDLFSILDGFQPKEVLVTHAKMRNPCGSRRT